MKHVQIYETCEGDMEDMLHLVKKRDPDAEVLHYGFDYIEVRLSNREEEFSEEVVAELLKRFEKEISEVYSEETGWFKIYIKQTNESMKHVKLLESFQLVPKKVFDTGNHKFFGDKADTSYTDCVKECIKDIAVSQHKHIKNRMVLERIELETVNQMLKEEQQLDAIIHNCNQRRFRPQYTAEVAYHSLVQGRLEMLMERPAHAGGLMEALQEIQETEASMPVIKKDYEDSFLYHISVEMHPLKKNHIEMPEETWKKLDAIIDYPEDEIELKKDIASGAIHDKFKEFFMAAHEAGVLDEIVKRSQTYIA